MTQLVQLQDLRWLPRYKLLHIQIFNKTLPRCQIKKKILAISPPEPLAGIAGKLQSSETIGPGSCRRQPEHSQHRAGDEVDLGITFRAVQVLVGVTNIQNQTDEMKGQRRGEAGDNSLPKSSVQEAHYSNEDVKLCITREIETLQESNFAVFICIALERHSSTSFGQIYRLRSGNVEWIFNLLQYSLVIKGSVFTFDVERELC